MTPPQPQMLTPAQFARKAKVSSVLVCRWIRERRIAATSYGRFYLIDPAQLAAIKNRPSVGRPKNS